MPVGGVTENVSAAKDAGAKKAHIPFDNDKSFLHGKGIAVLPVKHVKEVIDDVFNKEIPASDAGIYQETAETVLTAESAQDKSIALKAPFGADGK